MSILQIFLSLFSLFQFFASQLLLLLLCLQTKQNITETNRKQSQAKQSKAKATQAKSQIRKRNERKAREKLWKSQEKLGTLLFSLLYGLYGICYSSLWSLVSAGMGEEGVLRLYSPIAWALSGNWRGPLWVLGQWQCARRQLAPDNFSARLARCSVLGTRLALVTKILAWGWAKKSSVNFNFRFAHFICT